MDMNKTQKCLKGKRIREKDTVKKVVYISTPMKVKTSASKFRAIVQELTGRESDVVGIMENNGGRDTWMVSDHHHQEDPDDQFIVDLDPVSGVNFGCFDHDSSNLFYDQFLHQLDHVFGHDPNT